MKKLLTDKRWEPILMLLGNIAMFDWVIFPGLTAANTFINMLTVLVFIAMFLFDLNYIKETWFTKPEEEKQMDKEWKEHIMKQMEAMDEMHKQNESLKKKANPKQMDGVESDKPFVKTRNKTKSTVKIDVTDAKNWNEIEGIVTPIAEGRVKISVENPKSKRKPKTK